ncbi:hypothetical protein ACI2KS_06860 [Pseudomonas sp. NPDC087358]|uniref:hypothetical protein n=1 Tax=Pseudomonas sp. NPDC087358 TaxID=3364439 RepID=UPI003851525D
MLMVLGLCLAFTAFHLTNYKLRYKKQRKRIGLILIVSGATAALILEQQLDDAYVWAFVVAWCTGLELWFNCDKYGGNYK